MSNKSLVKFLPGDGTTCHVYVDYLTYDFPRGRDGLCAYCHGDPLAEHGVNALIRGYYERNPTAETCPMCHGAPS